MINNEDLIRLHLINGVGRKTISKIIAYIELKNIKLNNFSEVLNLIDNMKIDYKYNKINRGKKEL